jgi:hypothetical protein
MDEMVDPACTICFLYLLDLTLAWFEKSHQL